MNTHHAILVYADGVESASIPEVYKKQSVDVQHIIRDRFSIDDARELSASALQTPFESEVHVFVILVRDIAVEAQNALLKLFEEPPIHSRFFIIGAPTLVLLPTLQSRLLIAGPAENVSEENETFTIFKNASYADRLLVIAQKTKEKDRVWISQILEGCEREYVLQNGRNADLLKAILFVRTYIETKGASAKMLLEDIALRMPVQ